MSPRGTVTLAVLAGCSSSGSEPPAPSPPSSEEARIERPGATHHPSDDRLLSWNDRLVQVTGTEVEIDGTVHAFDGIVGAAIASVGVVVVHAGEDGRVATVIPDDGEPYDRPIQIGRDAAPIVAAGEALWTVDVRKQLVNRNPLAGGVARPARMPRRDIPEIAPRPDGTAFASQGHKLFRLDGSASPEPISWPSPEPITRLAVHGDTLWILTLGGRLVALDADSANVRSDHQLEGSGVALLAADTGTFVAVREASNPRGPIRIQRWETDSLKWSTPAFPMTEDSPALVQIGDTLWFGVPGAARSFVAATGEPR